MRGRGSRANLPRLEIDAPKGIITDSNNRYTNMAAVGFQDSQTSSMNFSLSLERSMDNADDLNQRIEEYKHQNPEDVEELKKCIQDVLGEAEIMAQERLDKKAVSWHVCPLNWYWWGDIFFPSLSWCGKRLPHHHIYWPLIGPINLSTLPSIFKLQWKPKTKIFLLRRATRRRRRTWTHSCRVWRTRTRGWWREPEVSPAL